MATPDGRAWLTSDAIAEQIGNALYQFGVLSEEDLEDAISVIASAYRATGYGLEFKILRLTEKLKDRITDGEFSTVEEITSAFNDIYNLSVLEQFDEEGNLIEDEDEDEDPEE